MARQRCEGTTKAGQACQSFATGERWCYPHNPANAERMREARTRGAYAAGRLRALEGRRRRLERPAELAKFLSNLAVDTLAGKVDPSVCRSVAYCAAVLRQVTETADLARRLEALEQAAASRPKGARQWA